MCFKTTTFGLNTYLSSSDDRIIKLVLQHKKKKKLHSVAKESRKFKFQFQLNMAQEESEQTAEAAKDIKKKTKQGYLDNMKMIWIEKPLHERYPVRTDNGGVDRTTTHQWVSSSSPKGEIEGFIIFAK